MKKGKVCALLAAVVLSLSSTGCTQSSQDSELWTESSTTAATTTTTTASSAAESKADNTPESIYTIDYTKVENRCTIAKDEDERFLKNLTVVQKEINPEDYKSIQITTPGILNVYSAYRNRMLVGLWPDGGNHVEELGWYDCITDTYTPIGTIPMNIANAISNFIVQDRYFVYLKLFPAEDGWQSELTIVDLQTDEIFLADSFLTHNIHQTITPVGEHALAYQYYEYDTQDWIVRYYDMETKTAKEIYRHTNMNKNATTSPTAIASDGTNIILFIQYQTETLPVTIMQWMKPDGTLLKAECIPLHKAFGGGNYHMAGAQVIGDYYIFSAKKTTNLRTAVYRREGDTFIPVALGNDALGYMIDYAHNGEFINILKYEGVISGAIKINFKTESAEIYRVSTSNGKAQGIIHQSFLNSNGMWLTIAFNNNYSDKDITHEQYCLISSE